LFTVSVFLGNGDGTFQPEVQYATGNYPYGMVTGDFNDDGKLDLAVSNADCVYFGPACLGTVSLLLGNGDGTFQPPINYPVGLAPIYLAGGDLNADGGFDLAVANAASNSVSVLLNLPVIGIFPNVLNFASEQVGTTSTPQSVTIGNPSGTPIKINKPKIIGTDTADFSLTNSCPISPQTLAPGSDCSLSVTFTAKATGTRTASISLADNVPGSPQTIALSGIGR
jgi:hypothetical protein